MTISDISVSTKLGRAAMYTIIAELPSTEGAASLATTLRERHASPSPISALYVLRQSDAPNVIDAYTFDRGVAEEAHAYLSGLAA